MPTNYWLKFGNSTCGFNGSGVQFTHVEQPGSLIISLNGIGTGFDTSKNFSVLVTFGSAISYTVNGTPVSTPSSTCTLTLHAGQVSTIGNIPYGTTFTISETVTDENYELQSITTPSGTMTDGGTIHSVVNNVYHAPGSLVVGVSLSGSGYDPTKAFGFVVTFGRAITYSVDGTPIISPSNTYTGSLADGGSVTLGNIPSGVTYAVTESALSPQDIASGYSTGSIVGGSGTMTDGGLLSATANYSYAEPPSGSLTISRSNGSNQSETPNDVTVTLSRAVKYTVDGVAISTPSDTATVTLGKGDSVTLGKLPLGSAYVVANVLKTTGQILFRWKDSSGTEQSALNTASSNAKVTKILNIYQDYEATAYILIPYN